jgi:hypothetical protein
VENGVSFVEDEVVDVEVASMDGKVAALLDGVAGGDVDCAAVVNEDRYGRRERGVEEFDEVAGELAERGAFVEGRELGLAAAVRDGALVVGEPEDGVATEFDGDARDGAAMGGVSGVRGISEDLERGGGCVGRRAEDERVSFDAAKVAEDMFGISMRVSM